jgi:hypothetical protein
LLAPRERTKLTAQYVECAFLGYSPEHKAYQCYDSSSHRMCISQEVSFNENQHFFHNPSTHSSYFPIKSTFFMYLPPIPDTSWPQSSPTSTLNVLIPITLPSTSTSSSSYSSKTLISQTYTRHSRSIPTASPDAEPVADTCTNNHEYLVFNHRYCLRDRGNIEPPDRYGFSRVGAVNVESSSYHEASSIPEWQLAMLEELAALERTDTWDIVPLPSSVPITCKWLFRVKTKSDVSIERYKASLVACGFQQT